MSTRDRLAAVATQLARLDALAPEERERTRALLQDLLAAHADALRRLIEVLGETPQGARFLDVAAADGDVAALLMLHGLHPVPLRQRIEAAAAALAPRLAAQHAQLALVAIDDDGTVRLRLEHRGRRGALHAEIEEAFAVAAADAGEIVIDETITVPLTLERAPRKVAG